MSIYFFSKLQRLKKFKHSGSFLKYSSNPPFEATAYCKNTRIGCLGDLSGHLSMHRQTTGILKKLGKDESKADITRFKGLGEMMPKVLWETTLSPKTRRLLRVEIADALQTDKVINQLMGKDPAERFQFIMEHAEDAVDIDV